MIEQVTCVSVDNVSWTKSEMTTSAQLVARVIATQRFDALEKHSLASIQTWRDSDQAISKSLVPLFKGQSLSNGSGKAGGSGNVYGAHVVAAAVESVLTGGTEGSNKMLIMQNILAKMHGENSEGKLGGAE
ncbi:hypothetical protein CCP2SC5_590001 [Azospirillaceae bacterium]